MDNQFDTLSRSYHDNYIEYKTTGKNSYKTAYESAAKGLQAIIDSLKGQVDANRKEIKDAMGSNAKSLWSEKQEQLTNIGLGIQKQKDRVVAAQMRQPPPPPPFSHQTQYIVLGSMLAAIVILQVV